jgi:hypothetical protein
MKKKPRKNVPWVPIVLAVCVALAAGYFIGTKRNGDASRPVQVDPVGPKNAGPKVESDSTSRENIHVGKVEVASTTGQGDECRKIQEDLKDFFEYLDSRPYVQQIEPGLKTDQWFNRIVAKLSTKPPVPAGEALDPLAITNHIFYFFRNLDPKEMKLLRDVMVNEGSTLEANLDLFFRWVSLGSRCPESGIRPAPGVLYSYAGFFLNTIGGRAYLFRAPPGVRRLLTYYCLLIVNDADKLGKNVYGIDIAPHLKALSTEMNYQGDLLFQKEYVKKLEDLQGFYKGR